MENLSKALIIAGGIAIGILTISIFYVMFAQIQNFADVASQDTAQEELLAFNQSFASYNKKLMYGTDVISVINKAIDNNTINNSEAGDNSGYSVDIIIKLENALAIRIEKYVRSTGSKIEDRTTTEKTAFPRNINPGYSLKNDKEKIVNLLVEGTSWRDTSDNTTYESSKNAVRREINMNEYELIYYPSAEIKRKTFYCEKVEYSDFTGRIVRMTFHEKV